MAAKVPLDTIDACLTAMTTAFLATSKLHLFTNSPTLNKDTVLADFTEATFTGSAAKTIATWSDPYTDPLTGNRTVAGADATFIATVVPTPETVNGWYLTDVAGTGLEAFDYLPQPVAIANVGDGLTVSPEIDNTAFC